MFRFKTRSNRKNRKFRNLKKTRKHKNKNQTNIRKILYGGATQQALLNLENGQYAGDTVDNKPNGDGIMQYHNRGAYYEGEWKNGKREGEGSLLIPGEEYYEGEWENDKRHGNGTMNWIKKEVIYQGEWKNDKRHGRGKMQLMGEWHAEGDWVNDKRIDDLANATEEEMSDTIEKLNEIALKLDFNNDNLVKLYQSMKKLNELSLEYPKQKPTTQKEFLKGLGLKQPTSGGVQWRIFDEENVELSDNNTKVTHIGEYWSLTHTMERIKSSNWYYEVEIINSSGLEIGACHKVEGVIKGKDVTKVPNHKVVITGTAGTIRYLEDAKDLGFNSGDIMGIFFKCTGTSEYGGRNWKLTFYKIHSTIEPQEKGYLNIENDNIISIAVQMKKKGCSVKLIRRWY